MWPDSNIGLATGKDGYNGSGLLVLDIDLPQGPESVAKLADEGKTLPITLTQQTGSGGLHYLFGVPDEQLVRNVVGLREGIDVKGDGGYVVVAPSRHRSGNSYAWSKDKQLIANVPPWLLRAIRERKKEQGPAAPLPERIPAGKRNATLASLAGSMRSRGASEAAILAALLEQNASCVPPLSEEEVAGIAASIATYPAGGGRQDPVGPLTIEAIIRRIGFGPEVSSSDITIEGTEKGLRDLRALAPDLDPIRRVLLREALLKRLREVGVRAPAPMVDAALQGRRQTQGDKKQGQGVGFENLEPWSEPVDVHQLLRDIQHVIRRFVILDAPDSYLTCALFTLLSYVHDSFDTSPLLGITSPVKRCGKSRLLEVLSCLVAKPLSTANITAAGLFRCVDSYVPTLLIDEADTFLGGNDQLRGILNSGWRRSQARVSRTVGDDHEPRWFGTWCPKVFALIKSLPDTLEDRSILIKMQRKRTHEGVERLRYSSLLAETKELRQKSLRWGQDSEEELKFSYPDLPPELDDRAKDSWEPLVAIGDLCGLGDEARRAARALSGNRAEGDSEIRTQLLQDIRSAFREEKVDHLPSANLVKHLTSLEDRPWPEWRRGKSLTAAGLARLLKPFGIAPKQIWTGSANVRGYEIKQFLETFSRYVSTSKVLDPLEPSSDAGLSTSGKVLKRDHSSTSKKGRNPHENRNPSTLAPWDGLAGGKETLEWQDI